MNMKHIILVFALSLISLNAAASFSLGSPYVGISGRVDRVEFVRRYGKDVYNRNLLGGSLFAGALFNECFGIEASMDISERKRRAKTLIQGQYLPGGLATLGPGEFYTFQTKVSLDSYNFGLVGFLPLSFISEETSLFASFGGSLIRFKARQVFIDGSDIGIPTALVANRLSFSFKTRKNRKWVPYLTIGIEQKLCERIGLRLFATWKNTKALNRMKSVEFPDSIREIKLKNTLGWGLGLFVCF